MAHLRLDWTPGGDPNTSYQRIYLSTQDGYKGKVVAEVAADVGEYVIRNLDEHYYYIYIVSVSKGGIEEDWKRTNARAEFALDRTKAKTNTSTQVKAGANNSASSRGITVTMEAPSSGSPATQVEVIRGDAKTGQLLGRVNVEPQSQEGIGKDKTVSFKLPAVGASTTGGTETITIRTVTKDGKEAGEDTTGITINIPTFTEPNHSVEIIASLVTGTTTGWASAATTDQFEFGNWGVRLKAMPTAQSADDDFEEWGVAGGGVLSEMDSGACYVTNATIQTAEYDLGAKKHFVLDCYDNFQRASETTALTAMRAGDLDYPAQPTFVDLIKTEEDGPIWAMRYMRADGSLEFPLHQTRWQYRVTDTTPITGDWQEWTPGAECYGRYVQARMIVDDPLGVTQLVCPEAHVRAVIPWSEDIRPVMDRIGDYTLDPTGFENRTDSTLTLNAGSRYVSIGGGTYSVWVQGKQFIKTSAVTLTWPDTDGTHFFYFNTAGELVTTATFTSDLIENYALACYVYWDATNNEVVFFGDERHGYRMDGATHRYLHETFGCRWEDGLALTNYTLSGVGNATADATVGVSDGEIHDEDIDFDITNASPQTLSPIARIPILYREGTTLWRKKPADSFPLIYNGDGTDYAGTLIARNDISGATWSLVSVGSNKYTNVWIIATTEVNNPVIGILSQTDSDSLATVEAEEFGNLNLTGLPVAEVKVIWRLTYQTKTTYSNTPKARLVDVRDYRAAQLEGSSYSVADHGSLAGLTDPDHPASAIVLDTSSLGGGAVPTATTDVQQAIVDLDGRSLESLSNMTGGAPSDGDILYYSGGEWVRLPKGSNGDVLTLVAGLPAWVTP